MGCAIIIPAYNAAAYLGEAIESALRQTVSAAAIAVVDDGSTDETPAICARFGDAVVALRQENQGVSVARNTGAAQVHAEWLLFLDADDRLLAGALEALLERAARGACGVVYGRSIYFHESIGVRREHGTAHSEGPPPAGALGSFWKSAITTPGAALIRASLFREIGGFNPAVNSLADREFWMKAGALAEFGFTPQPVIEKREHGANMSSNLNRALPQSASVQLGFFDWCAGRGIDSAFLQTTAAAVLDNALRKAFESRSLGAIAQLIALAEQRNLGSPLLAEARRVAALPAPLASLRLRMRAGFQRLAGLLAP